MNGIVEMIKRPKRPEGIILKATKKNILKLTSTKQTFTQQRKYSKAKQTHLYLAFRLDLNMFSKMFCIFTIFYFFYPGNST